MNGRDRSRGPPAADVPPQRDPRRAGGDGRNGGPTGPSEGMMSRADKFEDEKKRIIQSCFSRKDSDGTLMESYITHVRITEDSSYPSTPAPPTSSPESKKARVIVVAVRRSGRSYNALMPSSPLEQQHKQWAGNVGFLVTVGKPYYWHARTSKEKEFFIGSLVKIYRKYTGGKIPNLIGFDERERQLLSGTPSGSQTSARDPGHASRPDASLPPPQPPSSHGSRPQSPYSSRVPSRDGPRRLPSEEQSLRSQKSRDQMGRPSTSQSGRSGPPPFGPPQHPLPIAPDQRDQPPPRAAERPTLDPRIPKVPVLQPPEARNKDVQSPSSALSGSSQPDRLGGDFDESNIIGSFPESRPPSSKSAAEARPALRNKESSSSSIDTRRNKDGGRPTTAGSDNRSIMRDPASTLGSQGSTNTSASGAHLGTAGTDTFGHQSESPPVDIPPALKPTPAGDRSTPAVANISDATATPTGGTESREPEPTGMSNSPAEVPKSSLDEDLDAHRPGLGPMVKKKQSKDVAGAFRKAATAYGAFKPRAGGAGERLLAAAKKQQAESAGPDGITGVVPAPSLRPGNDVAHPETPDKEMPSSPTMEAPSPMTSPTMEPPIVEVTRVATEATPEPVVEEPRDTSRASVQLPVDERARSVSPSPHGRRRRRHEDNTIKYCQALGIEPGIIEGRGIDFDDILTDLGWNGRLSDEKRIEDLEADIRREIGRVEATSWLGNLEQQEGKVEQLAKLIDKTVEECEELENLLTLYSHELNTLHDDVAYIETQSQGLQVQTANQKLLHNELQNLLKTLSISTTDLRPLKEASLSNPDGLRDTEIALSTLYKAMLMIDSNIWQNKKRLVDAAGDHGSVGVYADTEIGQMRAIKEKKEEYRAQSQYFLQRLKQFMGIAYKVAEQKRVDASASGHKEPMKLANESRAYSRRELWMYNGLMLFAREVSGTEWQGLITLYEQQAKQPYQNDFRDNAHAWKKAARKPTGEEQELLFTHQEKEKEGEGITMAARKLTVRRGKTIKAATGFRLSFGEKQHGKLEPCEAFAGALHETVGMITEEQNFVVQFFHLSSLPSMDFPDLVASAQPDQRQLPDFSAKQSQDPDRRMARKVEQIMDEVYSFWPVDLQNMVDWSIKSDPLQGIGILFALEKAISDLDDTSQDFIIHSLQKIHARLIGLFNRFVDDQIRGIEDTKVKVNKRKGVISFMRVFPNFSAAIENMLASPSQEFFDIRISVNDAYDRMNRAMWESLKFIAKEAPGQTAGMTTASGDPEDKEVLNYHILLIENMNHYIEDVDVRGLPVLERWRDRAHQDMQEHLKLYLDAVIHRPLGRLLDFVESAERLMAGGGNPSDIASRPSHSRSVAKKVLTTYDIKEIRRGVELLKKRVEKHFGDADDPGLSRSLVLKVVRECEGRYTEAYDRTRRVLHLVYEGQLELEWRMEEVMAMFKK
ncbi:hypothetical protein FE257_012354 [Aspergillus nanangensis]|uniref:Exocyst complex component Sec3 PIP2-binding N-terminal domain-containing protein n=1 Tax=Aspergillus nanangensis TaxID=2582783 RepID=A0AAD4CGB2_ASPNN|nr:hypothetical protein FE257_012354 [Aspergillus nanangensis]